MRKKKIIVISLAVLFALVVIISAIAIISREKQIVDAKKEYENIKEIAFITNNEEELNTESKYLSIDHLGLVAVNPLYIGWLDIPDTVISYPIIWHSNNDDYLKRTFEGKWNQAGVIFVDSRSDPSLQEPNTVIYGHNIKDGSMFAELRYYMEDEFFKEHLEIHIYTPNGIHTYEVILVQKTDTRSPAFTFSFDDNEQRNQWIVNLNAATDYVYGLNEDSKIISLSTCTKESEVGRYIIQAVLKECVDCW